MNKILIHILTFITIPTIYPTDINDLNFKTIEHESFHDHGVSMNEIKITKKNEEKFKIKVIFNRPNLEEHKNKDQFDLELPIKFYYDRNTHQTKNVEQMLKERLEYIIKNGKSIDKLKDTFYDSYLLIDFGACNWNTFAIFSINDNCYYSSTSYINAPYKYYEDMLEADKNMIYHDYEFSENLGDYIYYMQPKEIHILLKNKTKASDVRMLDFTQEELYPSNLDRIKITRFGKEFRMHTDFNGPNIKEHPMKDNKYNIWLPIEIYYNRDDKDKIIEYIKPRLNNIIKDDTLDFDKLASEFPDSFKIIIFKKCRGQYWDMFNTEKRVYHSIINKNDSEFLLYSDMCTQNYEIQEMTNDDQTNHFKSPEGIRIILKKLKEENKTTNIDKIKPKDIKGSATPIPDITKSGKNDTIPIPNITKTKPKDSKDNKTQDKTTKPISKGCKCCGCCPCNKQPN